MKQTVYLLMHLTYIILLYGIGHIWVFYMLHPTDRIVPSTYQGLCFTSCGALAGTGNMDVK